MIDVRRVVSENRRMVVIITVALLINAALYALVVYPLAQRVQTGQSQAGDATQELVSARRGFAGARGMVTGKKEADEELDKFYSDVLPPDVSGARRVLYPHLDQLARKANVTTVHSSWDPSDKAKFGSLKRLGLTMSIEGDYSNVRRFIHELETVPEFIVLESVSVTTAEEGDRKLNVAVHVATYYRAPEDGN